MYAFKISFSYREISPRANLYDLDRGDKELIKLAAVLSNFFWKDPKWTRECNLQVLHKLNPLIPDQLQNIL